MRMNDWTDLQLENISAKWVSLICEASLTLHRLEVISNFVLFLTVLYAMAYGWQLFAIKNEKQNPVVRGVHVIQLVPELWWLTLSTRGQYCCKS